MTRMLACRMLAAALLLAPAALLLPASPAAAIPVFDPTNYAQNVLQAARALEQINNQVRSLQNETAMLRNMAVNLQRVDFPELDRITSAMRSIDRLIGEASGIDFKVERLDERLRRMFPGAVDGALRADARVADARARLDAAMASYRQGMELQAQIVANVAEDAQLLQDLSARSQGAQGALEVGQATNQLLALGAKQQLQLQTLMAAEFRGAALERATRAEAEGEARAATRRFLGSGHAYGAR